MVLVAEADFAKSVYCIKIWFMNDTFSSHIKPNMSIATVRCHFVEIFFYMLSYDIMHTD